ncbi:uncharacterized protein TNCV_2497221 [Trichonephila clavipes]|nr:uncharacterized protein TNCV_2497221 [Trichonephila clavipes]
MSPIEAIRFHENKFLLEDNFMGLANASINPTHNQIYYLHKCWRDANLGSSINPFDKLKEKVPFYESIGTTVKVHEDHLWAVLLVTPLMKRNHHLFSSKEIIFIDSTSSCEASSSTITILLSATKVGALPLAVMIHASQSIQNYINAFQLLKMNFPQCFGGQDYPEVFMSDDSSAEKGALAAVWPEAKQLLCHFHVAQAECGENKYIIKTDLGVCSCPSGSTGAFCKHQCALMELKKICLPNAPPVTPEDKHELALLALGSKCPPKDFFCYFKNNELSSDRIESSAFEMPVEQETDNNASSTNEGQMIKAQQITNYKREAILNELKRIEDVVKIADLTEESGIGY